MAKRAWSACSSASLLLLLVVPTSKSASSCVTAWSATSSLARTSSPPGTVNGRKIAPLSIAASSLRTTLNLYAKGDQTFLSRRSYLFYHMLVKLWHLGDARLSTQALSILVRAGCGFISQDHSSRLSTDRTGDEISLKSTLSSMPWSALVEDRQLYLLFDILDSAGKLVAGVEQMGDKEAVLFVPSWS